MPAADHPLFVTTPRNLEGLLASELSALGAGDVRETRAGVACRGDVATAMRLCLWSRLGSRVLAQLGETDGSDAGALFRGLRALPWERHLPPGATFAVDFVGRNAALRDSRYSARLSKDAIRARFDDLGHTPPRAQPAQPAIRCNLRLARERVTASIDLSGESLHRRGYRSNNGEAPLKEHLAAALLVRADWPSIAARGGALVDPFCGSGTLLVEAALMATDTAPGLLREHFGFRHWCLADADIWRGLIAEARERAEAGRRKQPSIMGFDRDARAVSVARENARRAGFADAVEIVQRALDDQPRQPTALPAGLAITNPPWGRRLEANRPVERLYMQLGDWAREALPGWRLAVFTGHSQLLAALGLRSSHVYRFYNGRLPARFGVYELSDAPTRAGVDSTVTAPAALVNRLSKNLRHLRRWAQRERAGAFRIYDADLPEYAVAVDVYDGNDGRYAHVAEYAPPEKIAPRKAEARRRATLAAVAEALALPAERVVLKIRRRRRSGSQYERQGDAGLTTVITEGHARLRVNLSDRLDTGVFLDHRPLRQRIAQEAGQGRFLNLFCYTGAATVHAALAGARTTSVDLSRTYLGWLGENLALNGIDADDRHTLLRKDCMRWLADGGDGTRYDVIFLDPPSVSRSQAMRGDLDIQRDHVALIRDAAALLREGGVLYFSTNRRGFRFDAQAVSAAHLHAEDISAATIPPDFKRRPDIHACWRITAR